MVDIRNYVCAKTPVSEKRYTVTCKEGVFTLPDAEIVVYWKQNFQWMLPQQIGDGMSIPLFYPKHPLKDLSQEAILAGMSVYQEYNETTGEWETYVYKYAGGDLGRTMIQNYLQQVGSDVAVSVEKGFTRLGGGGVSSSLFLNRPLQVDEQIAFLIGLCLGYGKPKQVIDGYAVSRHIGLPLVGSIAALYPQIVQLRDALTDQGLFTIRSEQKQKFGSLIQITLHDEVILSYINAMRFSGSEEYSSRYEQLLESISVFLGKEDGRLTNSVLKFISK